MRHHLKEWEALDLDAFIRLGVRVEPKQGSTLSDAADCLVDLLTSRREKGKGRLQTWILGEPANDVVELAIPFELSPPKLGVTQIVNLLSIPSEYDHCSALIFERIHLPPHYRDFLPGPRMGVEGTRSALGVTHGPILGAIMKPRPLQDLGAAVDAVRSLAGAGLHFLVDDELMVDSPSAPFADRLERVVGALNSARGSSARATGFVANVTARPSQAASFADEARRLGACGLVTNPVVTGFGALEDLAAAGRGLPIFATNMGTALLAKRPKTGSFAGLTEALVAKLTRLAGADAIHGGIHKSDWYAITPADGAINVLSGNIGGIKPAFRVIAGGLDIPKMMDNWPLDDEPVIFEAGSSVFSHPDGPAAGAQALRTAYEIALEHISGDESSRIRAKAVLLQALERNGPLAIALDASGWRPDEAVTQAMRQLPKRRGFWSRLMGGGRGP